MPVTRNRIRESPALIRNSSRARFATGYHGPDQRLTVGTCNSYNPHYSPKMRDLERPADEGNYLITERVRGQCMDVVRAMTICTYQ